MKHHIKSLPAATVEAAGRLGNQMYENAKGGVAEWPIAAVLKKLNRRLAI
jgi:hypothetical protein